MSDQSYLQADIEEEINELFPPVRLDLKYGTVLIFDGLPVTTSDKMDKLQALVQRVISDDGQIKIKDFFMPKGPDGKTKGYAFVDFHTAADARSRLAKFQNFALTKKDIFKVTPFEEFSELQKIPQTYEPKQSKDHKPPVSVFWILSLICLRKICKAGSSKNKVLTALTNMPSALEKKHKFPGSAIPPRLIPYVKKFLYSSTFPHSKFRLPTKNG